MLTFSNLQLLTETVFTSRTEPVLEHREKKRSAVRQTSLANILACYLDGSAPVLASPPAAMLRLRAGAGARTARQLVAALSPERSSNLAAMSPSMYNCHPVKTTSSSSSSSSSISWRLASRF
ncbi:hypothetical protein AMECASPLE_033272 [Ameca splendens]|uniref:Uncharacterized protein n=1 Tax=Ameca splendens TaxID=208324 RepID=A0ABV0XW32_9TELE